MAAPLPQRTIAHKRDGLTLSASDIQAFVGGLTDGSVSDAQAAAWAMAVCCRGMDTAECVALTLAMQASGTRLDWHEPGLDGPVVDKHSTGGVGDTVSLMLGPMLAACGCFVPMISGRGLGHTGGTLDKLEAIPGYSVRPSLAHLQRLVRETGVAIVGAGDTLAPADRRLYAVRDVTATVESVPLITASILSKKLAAGLQSLVLDVKFGSGAFMRDTASAQALAHSLVSVGCGAGLPTLALLTDMDEPLAPSTGNALEVQLTIDYLTGKVQPSRLHEVVMALGAALLQQAGVAADELAARTMLDTSLANGQAAERFARMVAGLGGPNDLLERTSRYLAAAKVVRAVHLGDAATGGGAKRVASIATRDLGWAVVQLGGGRRRSGDRIDASVGFSAMLPVGSVVERGAPLAFVHAADEASADEAVHAVQAAYTLADSAVPWTARAVVAGRINQVLGGALDR